MSRALPEPSRTELMSADHPDMSDQLTHVTGRHKGTAGVPPAVEAMTADGRRGAIRREACSPARLTRRRGDSDRPGAVASSPVGGMTALVACSRALRGAPE